MTVAPKTAAAPVTSAKVIITKVFVRGLAIEAEVGIYPSERGRRQPLVLDIELDVATAGAEHLSQTVNYETIANAARAIAAEGHIELVETFAERLAGACLADERVSKARVRVEKPLALAPQAQAAGVEITAVRA